MSKGSSQFEENVKTFFSQADKDKSGSVSCLELVTVLQKAGLNTDQAQEIFLSIDKNKDQKITLEELLAELKKRDPKSVEESELRAQFKKMDKDNSGRICVQEMQELLSAYGRKGNAAKYIELVDKDKDGTINYEEFLKLWREDN